MSRFPSMCMMERRGAGFRMKSSGENSGRRGYSPRKSFGDGEGDRLGDENEKQEHLSGVTND